MKGRVLIVDDELLILQSFGAILENEGFEVEAAHSAAAAIAALDRREFDLVITDMAMETNTAGYDVARAAQQQSYHPEVVILTGFHIPAAEWKKQGVKELFTKGQVTPATVVDGIKRIWADLAYRRPVPRRRRRMRA
jgi:DNA-binding NtrC family response regulator